MSNPTLLVAIQREGESLIKGLMPAYALHFAPLCDDKISKKHQKEKPSSQLQQHCKEMVEALSASNSAEENILVIQSAAFAGRRML
ncbi:MAG: hypothetical protein ACTHJ4_02095, partial [Candidatus Nucleicultricaceae bacterium]